MSKEKPSWWQRLNLWLTYGTADTEKIERRINGPHGERWLALPTHEGLQFTHVRGNWNMFDTTANGTPLGPVVGAIITGDEMRLLMDRTDGNVHHLHINVMTDPMSYELRSGPSPEIYHFPKAKSHEEPSSPVGAQPNPDWVHGA